MIPRPLVLGLIPLAYVLGSIPFGLLVGLWRGLDVRKAGSGNIGATNVGRLLGGRYFALVFGLDLLKGLLPMLAAAWAYHSLAAEQRTWSVYLIWLLIGLAAILGHMFSLFLRFKGGKGVATSAGVMLGLWPYYTLPGVVCVLIFVGVFLVTRYVSVGSIVSALALPVVYVALGMALDWDVWGQQWPLLVFAVFVAFLIVYKHRGNLARLRAGTESRFGHKPQHGG